MQEIKKSLKVITNNNTLSFGELDAALSEASYIVNSRPLQLNPTMGEDGFIRPNDILFGRSDNAPVGEVFDDKLKLTRRVAHKSRIIAEYWTRWINSYYQTLVKYHKWKLKSRNTQPGDVVLILDKEAPKGKYTLGIIDAVKVDDDGVVRKLRQSCTNEVLINMPYKYAQRNVRGLALLITAEERNELQEIDLYEVRLVANNDAQEEENLVDSNNAEERGIVDSKDAEEKGIVDSNDEQKETFIDDQDFPHDDENSEDVSNEEEHSSENDENPYDVEPTIPAKPNLSDVRKVLPPTSSGRRRFLPKRLEN